MPRLTLSILLTTLTLLAACNSDYHDRATDWSHVSVDFDWTADTTARADGMTLLFYPTPGPGGEVGADNRIWRFDIPGDRGGMVKIPPGYYDIIAYNSNAYTQATADTGDFNTIYTYTGSATDTLYTSYTPTPHRLPDRMWSASAPGVHVYINWCYGTDAYEPQHITLSPLPLCAYYTIQVRKVSNPGSLRRMAAILGDMPWALNLSDRTAYGTPQPLAFAMQPHGQNSLISSGTPFYPTDEAGQPASHRHALTLLALLRDNTRLTFDYDVTDQIRSARDPRHVTIVIDSIALPLINDPDSVGQEGIDVRVDGWHTVDIPLSTSAGPNIGPI